MFYPHEGYRWRDDRNNDPKKYQSDHNLSKKKKKGKGRLSDFLHLRSKYEVEFQIENRKIERGIAEMPFSPFFVENT